MSIYPAGSTYEVDHLLDFPFIENGPIVHFWWLVVDGQRVFVCVRTGPHGQRVVEAGVVVPFVCVVFSLSGVCMATSSRHVCNLTGDAGVYKIYFDDTWVFDPAVSVEPLNPTPLTLDPEP